MISGLSIRSFRNFKSLDLRPKAFNIIEGFQGTGKTTLLEAIALTDASDHEFHSILRHSYHDDSKTMDLQKLIDLNFFAHRHDLESFEVKLRLVSPVKRKERLFAIWKANDDMAKVLGTPNSSVSPYIFVFDSIDPKSFLARAIPYSKLDTAYKALKNAVDRWPINFIGPDRTTSLTLLARYYEVLQRRPLFAKTIRSLIECFNNVESIGLNNKPGKQMMLVKTRDRQYSVPLYGCSSSLTRMLSIIIYLSATDKSYFLIDDFDKGLTEYELAWLSREVYNIASLRNIQVFITTRERKVGELFNQYFENNTRRLLTIDLGSTTQEAQNEVYVE